MPAIKLLFAVALLTFPNLVFAQIGAKLSQEGIYGEWVNGDFGYQITLLFKPDGSGVFDGDPFTYTTRGNTLSMSQEVSVINYTYGIAGNTLTLSEGDLVSPVSFTRAGTVASDAKTNHTMASNTQSTDITGVWSGNGETLEFKSDGMCIYLGQSFPYEVSQDHVTFKTDQGNMMFAYRIQGEQLSLSANGQSVNYQKGSGATGGNQQSQTTGSGQVPMELVGQWCYIDVNSYNQGSSASSRCITLYADGSYTYFSEASRSVNTPDYYGGTNSQESDRGTWYVQGDRIYYNSQSTGQGSYRLEKRNHPKNVNDPMIVLDGEAYVTATQKAPWR